MLPIVLLMCYLDEVKHADWDKKLMVPAISWETVKTLGGASAIIYSLCLIIYLMD